jgi:hypothetical protein
LRRANQEFNMPKEIRHDKCRKLSLSAEGGLRQVPTVTWKRRATGPERFPPPPPPIATAKQRTPWVPREFTVPVP